MRPDIVPANFKLAIYGNQYCTADSYYQCHNMADSVDFENLVAGYYTLLYQFAVSLTRAEADSCDLVQQTFFKTTAS